MIECPYCKNLYSNIKTHIFYKHGKSYEDFKREFPNFGKTQETVSYWDGIYYKCEFCKNVGKTKRKSMLLNHYKKYHYNELNESQKIEVDKYVESKNKLDLNELITCPICERKVRMFKQHIERGHCLNWNKFCEDYNFDKNLKCIITKNHKNQLSINKKLFYQSEIGLDQRKHLSKKFSGNGNFAKLKYVREKISKSMLSNNRTNQQLGSFGLIVNFIYNNQEYFCRSFVEFRILFALLENNIPFEYEKNRFLYELDSGLKRIYISDLKINDHIYEIKAFSGVNIEEGKFKGFDVYNKNIRIIIEKSGFSFKIVNYSMLMDELNLEKNPDFYYANKIKEMLEKNEIKKLQFLVFSRSKLKSNFFKKYNIDIEKYACVNYKEFIKENGDKINDNLV